jgi:hypothetical protein
VLGVRLKRVVDFSWWHDYQGIFDVEAGVLGFLLQPDLMETLAADAAAQMSVDLGLVRHGQMLLGSYYDTSTLGSALVNAASTGFETSMLLVNTFCILTFYSSVVCPVARDEEAGWYEMKRQGSQRGEDGGDSARKFCRVCLHGEDAQQFCLFFSTE